MSRKIENDLSSSFVDLSIGIKNCSDEKSAWMKISSVSQKSFISAMQNLAKEHTESFFTVDEASDIVTGIDSEKIKYQKADKEINMSTDINRNELDALLRANKAEVDAVASGMREEMAKWREEQNTQMSQLNATLSTISSKIDSKFDAVDGKIDGLKTSLTTTQWSMTIGIALVTIILSTVMIYSSSIIASAEKADTKQPQPTVIYVQQPNLAEPPQPTNNSK
ncbi:hypothetical protein [Providencia stuartii]|uniref:Uncharacterized protein n=1 Tax=Providencia stuartii TaxID=588 RepID=A0AAI9MV45_PROST|nr:MULTISPECIES: hypothetical protein [Providencia]ELR5034496.1 hypothetical protein [Providencia stuartii]MDF4176459.1 hypothetical protein [Providencia thailandensis]CAK6619638.1 hypothetical protein PS9952019_22920 [Providencia stuartii]CAK6619716.1 hypothetical protein PSTU1396_23100 [Providencia stuartii]